MVFSTLIYCSFDISTIVSSIIHFFEVETRINKGCLSQHFLAYRLFYQVLSRCSWPVVDHDDLQEEVVRCFPKIRGFTRLSTSQPSVRV